MWHIFGGLKPIVKVLKVPESSAIWARTPDSGNEYDT